LWGAGARARGVGLTLCFAAKNVRFIAELTKFQVCPPNLAFGVLKVRGRCWRAGRLRTGRVQVLLDDFSATSIDLACNFIESAGRFLYRNPTTRVRMANMVRPVFPPEAGARTHAALAQLDILMRKKSALHLDNRQVMMVENAYYQAGPPPPCAAAARLTPRAQCNPPEKTAQLVKERPVLHEYVRKLVYLDLAQTTVEKVLKQLRKLPWGQPQVGEPRRGFAC
jgi:regulator of nonsense transcripts 2